MKKIIKLILVLSTFIPVICYAQDTTQTKSKSKSVFKCLNNARFDSLENPGRNEVFFNVAPYMVYLLGGTMEGPRLQATYKRVNKNYNGAFRFGLGLQPSVYSNFENVESVIYPVNDTFRIANSFWRYSSPAAVAKVGYEWRGEQKKRFQFWAGFDLTGGTFTRNYQLVDVEEYKDMNGNWQPDYRNGLQSTVFYEQHRERFFMAGMNLNLGLRYTINRYFLITAQAGYEAFWLTGETYTQVSRTQLVKRDVSQFDLNMPGIVNELAVVFRF
ncbi:MAG: hypothetical protein ACRC3B_08225 [Bacteroidia bacterium]